MTPGPCESIFLGWRVPQGSGEWPDGPEKHEAVYRLRQLLGLNPDYRTAVWVNPSTSVVHLVDDRFAGGRLGAFSAPPGPFLVKIGPNESSLDAPVDAGPLPRPFWSATDVSFPLRPAAAWKAASMEGLTPCVARWVPPALPDQRSPRSENPRLSTRSHVA